MPVEVRVSEPHAVSLIWSLFGLAVRVKAVIVVPTVVVAVGAPSVYQPPGVVAVTIPSFARVSA